VNGCATELFDGGGYDARGRGAFAGRTNRRAKPIGGAFDAPAA